MAQTQKISSAAHAVAMLSDIDLVMEHLQGKEASVALVHHSSTNKYAVCKLDFRRRVVSAPLQADSTHGAHVAAVLTEDGLRRVLDWTDREAAMTRFAALSYRGADPNPTAQ